LPALAAGLRVQENVGRLTANGTGSSCRHEINVAILAWYVRIAHSAANWHFASGLLGPKASNIATSDAIETCRMKLGNRPSDHRLAGAVARMAIMQQ